MTVTLDELRTLCVPSVRELRAFHHVPTAGSTLLTARPQRAIRIERLAIPDEIAASFVIHDLRIAGRSQFVASASGELFAASGLGLPIDAAPVAAGTDVALDIEYIGEDPYGRVFLGTFNGTDPDSGSVIRIPIRSNVPIRRFSLPEVVEVIFDDAHYRFEAKEGQLAALITRTESVLPAVMPGQRHPRTRTHYFNPPRVVSLRVEHFSEVPYVVFYAIDEETGKAVLEIGEGMADHRPFRARCDPAGYVPEWWQWRRSQLYQ